MSLINKLPQSVTRTFGKLWLKTKKASPEICVISGIACGAGALVLVGIKTWKHKEQLTQDADAVRAYTTEFVRVDEEKEKTLTKKEAKKVVVSGENGEKLLPVPVAYKDLSEKERDQLIARRIDFAKDICKVYWLPVGLEVLSGVLIWKGRTILRKDLSAMTAAYAAAMEAYRKYREKVAEKYGKEADQQLAFGYDNEIVTNEDGTTENLIKPQKDGNLNPYGFWFNGGYFDDTHGEWIYRNELWWNYCKDKNQLVAIVRGEQEQATRELRTIGYWRLENTMLRLGQPPKEAAKYHNYGKVFKPGEENRVSFGVLDDDDQLPVNAGFVDFYHSQDICYINPNVDGYIGYIDDELEKYDFRYGAHAESELPYKSFNREANRLIERYHKEEMERKIFNNMSDSGKRRMAKILK